jgi:peptidoglycan/LPS O-acetylase OafA/YrhL
MWREELALREERLAKLAETRAELEARAKERLEREMAEHRAKLAARTRRRGTRLDWIEGISMQREGQHRLHFLDSLRGLAALYVVAFHLLLVPSPNPVIPIAALSQFVKFGATGVFLFFVISGFSLSLTMPRHHRTPWPAASYGVSRVFRIAPLFYTVLVLTIIQHVVITGYPIYGYADPRRTLLLNVGFLFNLVPNHQEGIVAASWTIGVEMLFYAAFLPIYRLSPLSQIATAAAIQTAFIIAEWSLPADYTYFWVLGWFPLFIIGMLTFELYDFLKDHRHARTIGSLAIVTGLTILVICITAGAGVAWRIPIGFGYAALLIGCALHDISFLRTLPLLFYGRISYSVYLLHAPIIYHCSGLYQSISSALPLYVSYWICLALTILIVTPFAFLTYRFIEAPGIRSGSRLLGSLWRRPLPGSASSI